MYYIYYDVRKNNSIYYNAISHIKDIVLVFLLLLFEC